MRRTPGNIDMTVCYRFHLADVMTKFKHIINASESNIDVEILSEDSVADDPEFQCLNIFKTSLLLTYKEKGRVNLFAVIEHFPQGKEYAKILSYDSPEEFFEETKDIKETGNLIGDITYNILTNQEEAILGGYIWRPYNR
jgi:hypothetical protein